MSQYYTYKKQNYSCKKCKWKGLGEQTQSGDIINWDSIQILCPQCYNLITVVMFPTFEETMEYGSEEEKVSARERQDFLTRLHASQLKKAGQLPDIEASEIIISLREEAKTDGKDGYIVLYWKEKELWREIRGWEYYERYLELGNILKEKYGSRLIDFEADETTDLGGDYAFAFDKVRKFRNSLKTGGDYENLRYTPRSN